MGSLVVIYLIMQVLMIGLIICIVPILVMANIKWVSARDIKPHYLLKTNDGEMVKVISIKRKNGASTMYNLTVSSNHDFFINIEDNRGILVHNMCGDRGETDTGEPSLTPMPSDDSDAEYEPQVQTAYANQGELDSHNNLKALIDEKKWACGHYCILSYARKNNIPLDDSSMALLDSITGEGRSY